MEIITVPETNELLVKIDKSLYDHEAVLAAAYKFTDAFYIRLDSTDSQHYGAYFSAKKDSVDIMSVIGEFCNELIDAQIRHDLEKSSRPIKALIIKKAFFPFQEHD
ncbi:MAG: His-Xaa-Ser system protein HxsD [Deltaproteobacteria bacterium]|nr:His-Xaa-Ser system protein HxsD [Deltaproteobacteria bacterium]